MHIISQRQQDKYYRHTAEAGIHKICKAARGTKQKCSVEHAVHISNQITTLATANPVPTNKTPYHAINTQGSGPKLNICVYL